MLVAVAVAAVVVAVAPLESASVAFPGASGAASAETGFPPGNSGKSRKCPTFTRPCRDWKQGGLVCGRSSSSRFKGTLRAPTIDL